MIGRFFHALGAPFRALLDPEGRRAWALLLLSGCSLSMTGYVIFVLWLVRGIPKYAFYLGVGGFLMIAIVTTGFAGLLVRRSVDLSALGVRFKVDDKEMQEIANKIADKIPTPPPPIVTPQPATVVVQTGASSTNGEPR